MSEADQWLAGATFDDDEPASSTAAAANEPRWRPTPPAEGASTRAKTSASIPGSGWPRR